MIVKRIQGAGFYSGRASGRLCKSDCPQADLSGLIVALEAPSVGRLLDIATRRPAGVILGGGGPLSHLGIYLSSSGIPTLSVSEHDLEGLPDNVHVLLDGYDGVLHVDPEQKDMSLWEATGTDVHATQTQVSVKERAVTEDGQSITVAASVTDSQGAKTARESGADEIGLLRSEFSFPENGDPASPQSNLLALREVSAAASPLLLRVRLFDVGGEKQFGWMPQIQGMDKSLGIRGSRIYDTENFQKIFHAQVEAVGRLSEESPISVMLPFLTSAEEFFSLRERIENIIGGQRVKIGAMVETPSMCFAIPELAERADFLAIGTNDLMQCFFGADRALSSSYRYLDPYAPGLWRLLQLVVQAAGRHKLEVLLCGQLALFPHLFPLCLALGFRGFSVEPRIVPALKEVVSQINVCGIEQLATGALDCHGSQELQQLVERA